MKELELVIERGAGAGKRLPVSEGDLVIGRDPGCDLALVDPKVSRRHAMLHRRGDELEVEDLGSVNRTWVNSDPVKFQRTLAVGDHLEIGDHELRVCEVGALAATAPDSPPDPAPAADPAPAKSATKSRAPQTMRVAGPNDAAPDLAVLTALRSPLSWWLAQRLVDRLLVLAILLVAFLGVLWVFLPTRPRPPPAQELPVQPPPPPTKPQPRDEIPRSGPRVSAPPPSRPSTVTTPAPEPVKVTILAVTTTPADVEVYVDGKSCGRSVPDPARPVTSLPLEVKDLAAGKHQVQLRYGAQHGTLESVALREGRKTTADLTLFVPNVIVRTSDGRSRLGVLVSQDQSTLVLVTAPGRRERVPLSTVVSVQQMQPVVLRDQSGVKTQSAKARGTPELIIDPFPEDG